MTAPLVSLFAYFDPAPYYCLGEASLIRAANAHSVFWSPVGVLSFSLFALTGWWVSRGARR